MNEQIQTRLAQWLRQTLAEVLDALYHKLPIFISWDEEANRYSYQTETGDNVSLPNGPASMCSTAEGQTRRFTSARQVAWYAKGGATFADAIAFVRRIIWGRLNYMHSAPTPDSVLIPQQSLELLMDTLWSLKRLKSSGRNPTILIPWRPDVEKAKSAIIERLTRK